ncbi:MAG TPA: hypothetical protein VE178_21340 [Silvibacterium sp.]|jgi:hypothetical protein|nr:hypothetical protein [Silvibacterium sp.]
MKVEEATLDGEELNQKLWYQMGSISAVVLGIGYVVIICLYARTGAPPNGGEAWFRYLPGKTTLWWAILGLSVFTDFLYLPLGLALYLALKKIDRYLTMLATTFIGLFVVLDLAVTWTHYASILTLYARYSAAITDSERAGYLAAANYGSAVLLSPLEIVYAIVTLSFGILITGFIMLRGRFDRFTAYLGLATGILGIASLTGYSLAIIGNALLAIVWLFSVSYRLHRLAC